MFGDIVNGMMLLNKAGCMIHGILKDASNYFVSAKMDTFIVMPNHIHGIVGLYDTGPAQRPAPTHSLPEIIAIIKSYTTHLYSQGVRELGYLAFSKRLWQRNYYEHIIRNENSLKQIRQYIFDNPLQWERDKNNTINRLKNLET